MNHDSLRKAAILIGALDRRSADALLDQMPEEQAALVRRAVMELDRVDDAEQETVIEEFLQPGSSEDAFSSQGVELALSRRATETATYAPRRRPSPEPSAPFRHLDRVDTHQLVALLSYEHPQTIAVITAQLPPARASQLLLRLPDPVQSEVVRRIAVLGETDPEIVREIQEAIDARLSAQAPSSAMRSGGVVALQAILAATEPHQRGRLVARLAGHDPDLAQQLGLAPDQTPETSPAIGAGQAPAAVSPITPEPDGASAPIAPHAIATPADVPAPGGGGAARPSAVAVEITFADLVTLDDPSLATIFHHALPESAILALTGASHELVNRILRQLSSRQARRLQRQMCQLGPIRLRDVEHAQRQLARLASQLCQQGLIAPPARARQLATAA